MLVLSRNVGEAIVVDDRIVVRVASVQGKRIRLTISAPRSVPVHREEVQRTRDEFLSNREYAVEVA